MFDRFFTSRLRAAELALRNGALDEAFRLASASDLRGQARALDLLRELTPKLIERAESHLAADRFAEALGDLAKAEAGGVMQERIAQLRRNVRLLAEALQSKQKERRDRVEAVREHLKVGTLEQGRRILEQASMTDDAARRIQEELSRRMNESKQAYDRVASLLAADQWHAAAEAFARAKAIQADAAAAAELETRLVEGLVQRCRDALKEGRMIHAQQEMKALTATGSAHAGRLEMEDNLRAAVSAGHAFSQGEYSKAREELARVSRRLGEPAWIQRTLDELRQTEDLLTSIHAGVLGEAASLASRTPSSGTGHGPGFADTLPIPARPVKLPAANVPHGDDRLLLLVDGGGSYLVIRKDRVSIGRAASTQPADVPLFSDLAEYHAEIARIEDDYFLFSPHDVEVDGFRGRQHLLRDGSRIVLGRRAKLTFRIPSRRSPSAVLDVSDSSKLPNDVRRVVLFKDSALIGHGPGSHMLCNSGGSELLLFERGGRFHIRPYQQAGNPGISVELGTPMLVADSQFVLKPWASKAGIV